MPHDLTTETLMTIQEVMAMLPPGRRGRPVHFTTVLRWIEFGVVGPGGGVVRLEATHIGGRYLTSREAFSRFARRLKPRFAQLPRPRTQKARQRAADRAGQELAREGI